MKKVLILVFLVSLDGTSMAGGSIIKRNFLVFPADSFLTHNVGDIELSVTNWGMVGYPRGFRFPKGGPNGLFWASFEVATDPNYVVDAMYNMENGVVIEDSHDWLALTPVDSIVPPRYLNQEFQTIYIDSGRSMNNPKGLRNRQYSLASSDPRWNSFVIVRNILKNTSTTAITGLYVGCQVDLDISTNGQQDWAKADITKRWAYQWRNTAPYTNLGIKLLEPRTEYNKASEGQHRCFNCCFWRTIDNKSR